MVLELLQITAVAYLLAGVAAAAGLTLRRHNLLRTGVILLVGAAGLHGISFSLLHTADPTPPLTDSPSAVSFMAWVATVSFLLLLAPCPTPTCCSRARAWRCSAWRGWPACSSCWSTGA